MGAWGEDPWENDTAADWYGDLFEETDLAARIQAAVSAKPAQDHVETIRAAAFLVDLLARTYIWPVDEIDNARGAAREALAEILESGEFDDSPAFADKLRAEIEQLAKSY